MRSTAYEAVVLHGGMKIQKEKYQSVMTRVGIEDYLWSQPNIFTFALNAYMTNGSTFYYFLIIVHLRGLSIRERVFKLILRKYARNLSERLHFESVLVIALSFVDQLVPQLAHIFFSISCIWFILDDGIELKERKDNSF